MKTMIITAKYSGPSSALRSQLNKYEIYKNGQSTGLLYGADTEEEAIEMYSHYKLNTITHG